MKKAIAIVVVLFFCMGSVALAEQVTDDLAVEIVALEALVFDVVEETVSLQFVEGATDWLDSDPISMEVGGGASGTIRIYASIDSSDPDFSTLVTGGHFAYIATDNIGPMKAGTTPLEYGAVSTTSPELTDVGFSAPLVPPLTVNGNLRIDGTGFYNVYGSGYAGTINATVHFLAELL